MLQNNGTDDLTLTADGAFTFATDLADGAAYDVTVLTQPGGQSCGINNGSGTASANITNVAVNCFSPQAWHKTFDPVDGLVNTGFTAQIVFNATDVIVCDWGTSGEGPVGIFLGEITSPLEDNIVKYFLYENRDRGLIATYVLTITGDNMRLSVEEYSDAGGTYVRGDWLRHVSPNMLNAANARNDSGNEGDCGQQLDPIPGITFARYATEFSEAGSTGLKVWLNTEPEAGDVSLSITSSDVTEILSNLDLLTFNDSLGSFSWEVPQDLILSGQPDFEIDGDNDATVTIAVESLDSSSEYGSAGSKNISYTVTDDPLDADRIECGFTSPPTGVQGWAVEETYPFSYRFHTMMDGCGNAVAVGGIRNSETNITEIFGSVYSTGSGWGVPQLISDTSRYYASSRLSGAAYGKGKFRVAWVDQDGRDSNRQIREIRYEMGVGWSALATVASVAVQRNGATLGPSGPVSGAVGKYLTFWGMDVSPSGHAFMRWVYSEDDGAYFSSATVVDQKVAVYSPASGWGGATTMNSGFGVPGLGFGALDPQGNGVYAWRAYNRNGYEPLYARTYSPESGWSAGTTIYSPSSTANGGGWISVASNQRGDLMVVSQHDQVYTFLFDATSGIWGGPEIYGGVWPTSITLSDRGDAFALSKSGTVLTAFKYQPTLGWDAGHDLLSEGLQIGLAVGSVAADSFGSAMAVWSDYTVAGDSNTNRVFGSIYRPTSGWSAPEIIQTLDVRGSSPGLVGYNLRSDAMMVWGGYSQWYE